MPLPNVLDERKEIHALELARNILSDNKEVEKSKSLDELLKSNRLSTGEALSALADIMENTGSDALKLRAIESVLKLNGVMNDKGDGKQMPTFIINIMDKKVESVNPILLPRELHESYQV